MCRQCHGCTGHTSVRCSGGERHRQHPIDPLSRAVRPLRSAQSLNVLITCVCVTCTCCCFAGWSGTAPCAMLRSAPCCDRWPAPVYVPRRPRVSSAPAAPARTPWQATPRANVARPLQRSTASSGSSVGEHRTVVLSEGGHPSMYDSRRAGPTADDTDDLDAVLDEVEASMTAEAEALEAP